MKFSHPFLLWGVLSLALLGGGCQNSAGPGTPGTTTDTLVGTWTVKSATVGTSPTSMVNGVQFVFGAAHDWGVVSNPVFVGEGSWTVSAQGYSVEASEGPLGTMGAVITDGTLSLTSTTNPEGAVVLFLSKTSSAAKVPKGLKMTMNFQSVGSAVAVGSRAPGGSPSMQFAFGIEGEQSGALVAGYSADTTDAVIDYKVSIKGPNGEIWGSSGVEQPFVLPNPHVLSTLASGTTVTPQYGEFIVATESATPLPVVLKTTASNTLTAVNEMVLRLAMDGDWGNSNTTFIFSPHFVYTEANGNQTTYSTPGNNLTVNGQILKDFEYFLFVPASVVGAGFNYLASGNHVAANPMLNSEMIPDPDNPGSAYYAHPTSEWTLNPDWINDDVDNFALFAMIDKLAGTTVATRHDDPRWNALARYFQGYFAKFFKAGSTMFNVTDNNLQDYGPITGGLGNNGHSSFFLIALDDSKGPIDIGTQSTINVTFDPSGSQFTVGSGVMDVTGATPGASPFKFLTSVAVAP